MRCPNIWNLQLLIWKALGVYGLPLRLLPTKILAKISAPRSISTLDNMSTLAQPVPNYQYVSTYLLISANLMFNCAKMGTETIVGGSPGFKTCWTHIFNFKKTLLISSYNLSICAVPFLSRPQDKPKINGASSIEILRLGL